MRSRLILLFFFFIGLIQLCCFLPGASSNDLYVLLQTVNIPTSLSQIRNGLTFGGDIRVGDLQNKGEMDFLVYRTANSVEGGAAQPCFIGAFKRNGKILWQQGKEGEQPNRPGPVAIHDIDADGRSEVICLYTDTPELADPFSMQGIALQIRNGANGQLEKSVSPPIFQQIRGEGPNWVHQRILIANLSGNPTPQDFIIKLGKTILAFNQNLELIWTYYNPNDDYQNCPAYIPSVGDIDNDGRDEVNGGYYLLDDDGSVLWEKKLGKNMDSVAIDFWDVDTTRRAFCSGYGFVMDARGDTILQLGETLVPHGQELRVADFDKAHVGREMCIRYNGHQPDVRIIGQHGDILKEFKLNDSPNHTGMEAVYWYGLDQAALIYNGGTLWNASGDLVCRFSELKQTPAGHRRQGWYHCIPVDIRGDQGEEMVLYNPWENKIYLYANQQAGWDRKKKYVAGPKQYNVRLMD